MGSRVWASLTQDQVPRPHCGTSYSGPVLSFHRAIALTSFLKISISSLISIISFLLLSLGFVPSSFSGLFRWQLRLFTWDFSCFFFFWGRPVSLWIFLQELLLLHPVDFVWLHFQCHLSQGIFKFPFQFSHWPIGVFSNFLPFQPIFSSRLKWTDFYSISSFHLLMG